MNDWAASVKRIIDYYNNQKGNITIAVDGFVDDVWQVVESRTSASEYKLFEKVSDYANAILARGSGGMGFELMRKRRTYGGFAANTGQAVGRLGGDLTLLGMFGTEEIDPVFQGFYDNYNAISVGNPAVSFIYEFLDGKIMQGGTSKFPPTERSWEQLVEALGMDGMRKAFADANVVGFGYYGSKVTFDNILINLIDNFLADGPCHRMFFDFGNIQNRKKEQLFETFATLVPLNEKVPMTLSLNEHEGKILFAMIGREFTWDKPLASAEEDIAYAREQTGLDEVIIHTPFFALGASAREGTAYIPQRNATDTLITTGAGDNFNGGYLSTHLQKGVLSLAERLFIANAVTGAYVRSGVSPDKVALKAEMDELVKVVE